MDNSVYQNPLITRYASREMSENFSDKKRFTLWRKLWIALAESQSELGLNISDAQIEEMKNTPSLLILIWRKNMRGKCATT